MAEVTQLKRYDAPRINWGEMVSDWRRDGGLRLHPRRADALYLYPGLQQRADAGAGKPGQPGHAHAIWLTVMIALITVPVNLVFGTLLAWLVTRFTFPGRQLLLTLLDIPFAVSPVVAGLVYLLFYGSNGPLGGWLDAHNPADHVRLAGYGAGDHLCHLSVCGARTGAGDDEPGK